MPINCVLRNAHFSINSGAKFSQMIISLHLYNNYYDYQKIYINNMAKRQANCATNSLDKEFEIDTDTFVVVTNFNGHLTIISALSSGGTFSMLPYFLEFT